MLRFLIVLLLLLGAGCDSQPAGPQTHFVRLPEGALSFPLPAGWKPDGDSQFFSRGVGRLYVATQGPVEPEKYLAAYTVQARRPLTVAGQPASLVNMTNSEGQNIQALLVTTPQQLLTFCVFAAPKGQEAVTTALQQLCGGLQLGVVAPSPSPLKVVVEREPIHFRHLGSLPYMLLFLAFTGLPAYLGAGYGYANSELTGQSYRQGAASGAFSATFFSFLAASVLAALALFITMARSGGAGIMTPGMAGFIMAVVLSFLGLVAAGVAGALAAVGAALGAGISQRAACLLAASMAVLAVSTPFLIRFL